RHIRPEDPETHAMTRDPHPAAPASRWAARTFASLAHRNYRIYFVGQFVSLVGMWMSSAAQSWLVYDLTRSEAMLGAVGVAGSVPVLAVSVWGGILADRFPRRRILIACQVAFALLAAILATLVLTGVIQVWHILVLSTVGGIVGGIEMPSRQAFVIEMVGRRDMMNAIALNSSVFHASRILGPAIAGVVIAAWGTGLCFLANALSYGAVLAALLAMRLHAMAPSPPPTGSAWHQATEGFRFVARAPRVLGLLLLMLAVGVFGWSYVVLLPALARDTLGTDADGYGWMMSATGVGSVVGALWIAATRDIRSGRFLVAGSIGLFAVSAIALSWVDSLPVAILLLAPAGMGLTAFFSGTNTLIQSSVDDAVRGRVMGVYTLVYGLLMPVGAGFAGTLAEMTSTPLAIRVGAFVCLGTAIVAFVKRPPA
ncbi:MAG TPA: MFS transporter, partial [Myxococcota bacterium]|nr:MFS transporter [Myxococcota bacterium]